MWFACLDPIVFNRKKKAHTYTLENNRMLLTGKKITVHTPCTYISVQGNNERVVTLSTEPATRTSDHTVLYFHGRGEDLGSLVHKNVLSRIASATGCSVLAFEYPGYGHMLPSQLCMEDTIRAGHAIYEHLSKTSLPIVYGYSIGSGIAVEVVRRAATVPLCVFLEGAFPTLLTSTYSKSKPLSWIARLLCIDALETADRLPLGVPTYFVHGTEDEMCSCADAQRMAMAAGTYQESLWLENHGHYNAWSAPRYQRFLKETVEKLLKRKSVGQA